MGVLLNQFKPIIKLIINQQMPRNAKKCDEILRHRKEIQQIAKNSKRIDSTKRFGSGSGFFEAPVNYENYGAHNTTALYPKASCR